MALRDLFSKLAGGRPAAGAELDELRDRLRSDSEAERLQVIASLGALCTGPEVTWKVADLLAGFVRDRCPLPAPEEPTDLAPDVVAALGTISGRPFATGEGLPLGLFQVDLRGASFEGAQLRGADLSRSHLERCRFEGANLEKANLQEAFLDGAHLAEIHLDEANLLAADLEGADLSGSYLDGADLTQARLVNADLTDANLKGVRLEGAELDGAKLGSADLTGATGLTPEQLSATETDDLTILPAHLQEAGSSGEIGS